ncbi:TonB-dependent receptor [Pontibacter sp. G13]|uniref:SusC/RagA family TonB-linked outer membrane protein n=1 Tax=Pontibacter sp. G13 TaxID=3074898 RepID=UPI00288C5A88|nr:TonB-dependent receptor [Pontibacter sp. G13]WNJ19687.1 TonB-dependent receptor [Pontibacter sp. G13]
MKRKFISKIPEGFRSWKPGLLVALWMLVSIPLAMAQSVNISGVVTDDAGEVLPGVKVIEVGTTNGIFTDIDGSYRLTVAKGAKVVFSFTGFATQEFVVGDNPTINVSMSVDVLQLDEVLVTGYTSQRKKDITGAVTVVDVEELNQISATSFTQKLEGRAAGVQISTSGQPGEGTTVRIRGISSFGNNDPLYVIDGVPVQDSYSTGLNPSDIESMQVLKDASAASIYGARANNGVVIITTKRGQKGKPKVTYSGYAGLQTPIGTPDYLITDPMDYSDYVWTKHENAGLTVDPTSPYGLGRGVLPNYSYPVGNVVDESSYSYPDNIIMQANQNGTDWFDAVFDPALVTEHTVGVTGGSEFSKFYLSAGYLDQNGTMIHNYFRRLSLRANSEFNVGKLTFGETFSLTRSVSVGSDGVSGGNQDEQGVMTWTTLMNPLTPMYDIQGNYGGDKAPFVSNGSNPVALLERNKDNEGTFYRMLGSAYAELEIIEGLKAKTTLGFDFYSNQTGGFNFPTWENREVNANTAWNENWQNGLSWTWTSTLSYEKTFADKHELKALVGYEAFESTGRNIGGGLANYFTTDINAWYLNTGLADPETRSVNSSGWRTAILSTFGKVDYTFDNRYLVSAVLRRDGSSNFGNQKYGVFPAFSAAWRISEEGFMQSVNWISDLKLRAGWGITGNQNIPGGNAFARFGGGTSSTFYDITGSQTGLTTGYALTARGNADTKWEENVSANLGLDVSLFDGRFGVVLDVYDRTTEGLLYNPANPGTSGTAAPAFVNIASMQNRGIDVQLNFNNNIGRDLELDASLVFSHYRNEILDIDGSSESFFPGGFDSRIGIVNINEVGSPISTFYGLTADGLFRSQDDVDNHATQDGAAIGRIRFKDLNDDGVINDDDKGVIGNPHPDFTTGLNLAANYKGFDLSLFFFASVGNQVFNYNRVFDTFGLFNSNVRKEVLTNSFSEDNPDGDLPRLDVEDTYSQQPSSFYVEDASYLRLKNVQLGYTLPRAVLGNTFSNLRVYLQGQNLFTITNYSGIDPAPSNFGVQGGGGLPADQWNGFDFGNYPANRIMMIGVNASF